MSSRFSIYCVLIVMLLLYIFIIHSAGKQLVKNDVKVDGDAIIVLMGNIPDRLLETVDIYMNGYSNKVILVEEYMGAYKQLKDRGADITSNTVQFCKAAVDLGIPPENITILPGDARSTQMESLIIREYLKNQNTIDTLLLVSSAFHTRRATMIFKSAFRKAGISATVVSCPSKYSSFNADKWWKNREDIQKVLSEYLKIANFLLFEKNKL